MDMKQRYLGCLVGVGVGDAIGAPYETWGPKEIASDLEKRGGLHFFDYPNPWATKLGVPAILPAGRPTDDSDQTADLCHSLIICAGINAVHLRDSLQNSVRRNVSRLWNGKATGAGGTTRDTLSDDYDRVQRGLANTIGTNGSLMRCSPMGLWFAIDRRKTANIVENPGFRKVVWAMSSVTHAHQHCLDACWLYTRILIKLLRDEDPWDVVPVTPLEMRTWSRLNDPNDHPYDPGKWPARGTAEFSLYVALHALKVSKTFAEGIELTIRVGGDTDTYGAIAGGLLGAKFGYDGIPADWRSAILGHDKLVEYAKNIYEQKR